MFFFFLFFFSSRRRHTRCALVTGVQTCALPIYFQSFTVSQLTFLAVPAIADKSRIYGTELSARWNVADETKLDVSLVAQNARYTDFSGPGYDYSGFRMASAPVLTVVAGLQQGFDLGSSGHLVGRVSAQYNSGF